MYTHTQWAITVVLRPFGHKWSKKNDTCMVEGLLEAYYKDKLEKNTKSEFWVVVGAWGPKSKIAIFLLKIVYMTHTHHWYLILGQKHVVAMENH